MIATTAEVAQGLREILAVSRSEPTLSPVDIAHQLLLMLARDDSSPEPMDVAVLREVEDWVVDHWQDDSPELVDAMASLVLTCGMTRGLSLLEKAASSPSEEVRALARDALEEAAQDRLKGWRTVT